jgi:hypothetical protein
MLAGLSSAAPVELIGDTDTILGLGMRTGPLLCDLLRNPHSSPTASRGIGIRESSTTSFPA